MGQGNVGRAILLVAAKVVRLVLVAYVLAQGWWYHWMHNGWFGTPRLLHAFIRPDGEQSYNVTLLEMFVISLALVASLWLAHLTMRSIRRGKRRAAELHR